MTKQNGQHFQQTRFETEGAATRDSGPVTCLGLTFPNDEERRKHFLGILREKLKDPEFRKIEGFPIGSDEDILALSDPPYYTACPNPFLEDFIRHHGKPYDPATDNYRREPFASDTGAGKTHPIYTAHSYHSKIPHLATMPCILHYTEPGDIVLDGFSGSGMTGVAAQLCGQPEPEFKANLEAEWKKAGYGPPKWGARRPILIDLSPVANFIAYNLNVEVSAREFKKAADAFFKKIEAELGWMYETLHTDGRRKGRINYVVWSEVFTCPNCAGDVVFMDQAYDPKTGKFAGEFECPHCRAALTTRSCEHKFTSYFDKAIGETVRKVTYVPVGIEYTLPGDKTKYRKKPDAHDLALINRLANEQPKDWFPTAKLPVEDMVHGNILAPRGITHYHQFYLPRALHALSTMWRIAGEWPDARVRGFLKFMVEQCFWGLGLVSRYVPSHFSQVNQYLPNVFYIPANIVEISPWYILDGKYKRLQKMLIARQLPASRQVAISTASSLQSPIPDKSVDYIYTDPPFGDAIPYGDLNLLIEAWHNLFSNLEKEVLLDKKRKKLLSVYANLMQKAFAEYYRVLKPGRWMTVVFHNSKNLVWTAIQEAIGNAGFVVADVRTLDREQGSFKQVTAAGAVKQDLVISAYKPNGGLAERFKLEAGTEQGVWDFVRTHLKQLPVFVSKDGRAEIIAERQNYLLFDRMVAFHVQRGVTVPLSATEFYAGLVQRFSERDGMYFLPEQVTEYDKKRMTVREVLQLQLFVTDESSAIQWLRQQLLRKPQTAGQLKPQFMQEIGGWQKTERLLELDELLEQNFLRYDGKGPIPAQIVSWLKQSSQLRELISAEVRSAKCEIEESGALRTTHLALLREAKDRWYVPDPNKAGDLEKLRERSLLKEFEEYRTVGASGRSPKLKVFRLEAVRAGFKKAWQERDYATIITVARKIPENVLQEDPKLLMWYDQAMTRTGGDV
jgi:DNA modification methylase